jgi:hypothetical protein
VTSGSGWGRAAIVLTAVMLVAVAVASEPSRPRLVGSAYQVYPGEEIQEILELAAADPVHKIVEVQAGTYRPQRHGQALIWFNARHDGITLQAVGEVVLTAANPEIADPEAASFPAVVNHVVYLGDGVSAATVLRGFTITGANNFVTTSEEGGRIELDLDLPELEKRSFFYSDGGGIKIFGRSSPTLEKLVIRDNYTSPCGGGISLEQRGFNRRPVTLRNCVMRNNRAQITGSAIDLLPGSSAIIENCLLVGNISNTGPDFLSKHGQEYQGESGSGALTVFAGSRVWVRDSTFTGNWNGVDDQGTGSVYFNTIFWRNSLPGGISRGKRYELDVLDGEKVRKCFIGGVVEDVRGSISRRENTLAAPDPDFGDEFVPRNPIYKGVGFRPARKSGESAGGPG